MRSELFDRIKCKRKVKHNKVYDLNYFTQWELFGLGVIAEVEILHQNRQAITGEEPAFTPPAVTFREKYIYPLGCLFILFFIIACVFIGFTEIISWL